MRVGGYGEFRLGAGRGYQDILAAFVGTGIGGCVIQQGQILTGVTGNAGEIGHIIVKAGGPLCGCGGRGCLEAMASRTAITRRIQKAIRKGVPTSLGRQLSSKTSQLKSKDLAAAVRSADSVAVKEVGRAARFLGLALGGLINLLGPEIVIIGGGVTEALGNPWVEQVAAAARNQAMADPKGKVKIERRRPRRRRRAARRRPDGPRAVRRLTAPAPDQTGRPTNRPFGRIRTRPRW